MFFYNKNLTNIPREIGFFFPNILGLSRVYGNLNEITAEDMKQFSSLRVASLNDN